ncbi:hypothetical protein M9R32_01895 [Paenisporosarcina quisquiliarum]|uniref:Uncharacterized protein n=1 Tax=Paenisporosarcina quisquiliarum TaxID=365346 RepID=A0A9X3LFF2_9BACL|nr:hypothetical protein [Paenisporosarcina quisquiliarum]MCZ8535941.1 hypothetical protein [Paenisporosarcina quisquiliarum]
MDEQVNTSLEYRLYDRTSSYKPLFHYEEIDLHQVLARRECDFYVKEGTVYKQTSSAIEGDWHVIYVEKHEEGEKEKEEFNLNNTLKLEMRRFNKRENYPLLQTLEFEHHIDILSRIGSVYHYINGQEWEKDSAEIDEDRRVYVLYLMETGYKMEGINT